MRPCMKEPPLLKSLTLAIALCLTLAAPSSWAAKFANQFSEFELPPQWQCNLEGAEWVCQSTNEGKKRDAIIVLAAKLKGDQDSLDQYLSYLKAAKTFTSVLSKPVKSEPRYSKTVNLNGHPWVDALHLESEIPGFYTRYLATVKQDIGVLVTYSINKNKYQQYLGEFENMVKTLKVFRKTGGINAGPPSADLFASAKVPQQVSGDTIFPGSAPIAADTQKAPPKKDDPTFLLIVGGAAIVLFILWRRKRNAG